MRNNFFNGERKALNIGASYWIEAGSGISWASVPGGYIIGISTWVGASPPGVSGNYNSGSTEIDDIR